MEYITLLLVIAATAQSVLLHRDCNSDTYSSASGIADLQPNATLQYCLIDNCTIMRIDNGQQLDIVYTTESHLVVTPTDGQTSMIISKNEPELFCSTLNADEEHIFFTIASFAIPTLVVLVSGYIVALYMIFKKLRSYFGKLMMFYNLVLVGRNLIYLSLDVKIMMYPDIPCYPLIFLFMQSEMVAEGFATSILGYVAYSMYSGYKFREATKEANKKVYKRAIQYVLGSLFLFNIFIVSYEVATDTFKPLSNDQCSDEYYSEHSTIVIVAFNNIMNKTLQILFLVIYFVYYYKFRKSTQILRSTEAGPSRKTNRLFRKVAITLGATMRASYFVFIFSSYAIPIPSAFLVGGICLLVQQIVIVTLIMWSGKIWQLFREKFCPSKVSPSSDQ